MLKKNRSLNTTLSDDDKKEEIEYDEAYETDPNGTVVFNIVVDLKDTFLHVTNEDVNDDESIYIDEENEEVMLEEL